MRRAGILGFAIACAACGRIGFDVTDDANIPDAVAGHDEDEDGVADLVDVCPHLPGSQADTDGDRIGDDCDPEPANPRQALVLFATMQPADQPFTIDNGDWAPQADAIRYSGFGPQGRLTFQQSLGDFRMTIGVDIIAITGDAQTQKQIGIGAQGTIAEYYFAELNELPGFSQAAITETDGSTYNSITLQNLVSGLHTGRLVLEVTQLASTATVTMDGGLDAERYPLTAAAPFYTGGTVLQIFCNTMLIDLRFIWIVRW